MVAAAVASAELAVQAGPAAPLSALAKAFVLTVGMWAVGAVISPWCARRRQPWWISLCWLAAAGLPAVLDGPSALAHGDPLLLRQVGIASLRNLMLVAAALAAWRGPARMAAGISPFVVMLGISVGKGFAAMAAGSAYLVAGVVWLMVEHWGEVTASAVAGRSHRLPWPPAMLASLSLLAVFAAAVLFYPSNHETLAEMVSRWTGSPSPLAGNAAAARVARNQLAMRQLTDEKYGQGQRRGGRRGASSADDATANSRDGFAAKTARASQTFDLVRRQGPSRPNPSDERVLFEMENDLLRHVPVITYAEFDGRHWRSEPQESSWRLSLEVNERSLWGALLDPLDLAIDPQTGAISGSLGGEGKAGDTVEAARSAAAQWLARWGGVAGSISPRLSSADMRLVAELLKRPPGHTLDPAFMLTPYDLALASDDLWPEPDLAKVLRRMLASPEGRRVLQDLVTSRIRHKQLVVPTEIRALLEKWTAGKSPGWPQIRAVVDGIRGRCVHDPRAVAEPGEDDPLTHFLLRSRRGPDYLFASTAAVLLRSLGYPSRLAGGFYANPARRGWLSGRVAVRADDLHYWTQTRLPNGMWVDLEPTPGYELPGKESPPSHPLASTARRLTAVLEEHRGWIVAACVLSLVITFTRRRLADLAGTVLWRLRLRGDCTRSVLATWRLIEWRARAAGRPRPPGKTLAQWYPPLFLAAAGETSRQLGVLAGWADQAAFRPEGLAADAVPPRAVSHLCEQVVAACPRTAFRRLGHRDPGRTAGNPAAVSAAPSQPAWLATRFHRDSMTSNPIENDRHLLPSELPHDHDAIADRRASRAAQRRRGLESAT
jgi:hypothetical protein